MEEIRDNSWVYEKLLFVTLIKEVRCTWNYEIIIIRSINPFVKQVL